jgi:hypothetical protein
MNPTLDNAITDAVRRWTRPTTVEELQKRGVSNLRSISLTRVAALLEKAVNRALVARTIGDLPDDHDSFSRAARREFVRMMKAGEDPAGAPPEAGRALERLKRELRERRRVIQEQQAKLSRDPGVEGPADQELELRLQRLFQAWGGDPQRPSPLESEVIRLAVGELRQERRRGRQALLDDHRREIDKLERRVRKLSTMLEDTEQELQHALTTDPGDAGIASIYDAVQGLDGRDREFAKKSELMSAIFQANLELRSVLAR